VGTGKLFFRITWDTPGDVDIALTLPNGVVIWFGHTGPDASTNNGFLDHDNQGGYGPENAYWPSIGSDPETGDYHVCGPLYAVDPSYQPDLTVVFGTKISQFSVTKPSIHQDGAGGSCDPSSTNYLATYHYVRPVE